MTGRSSIPPAGTILTLTTTPAFPDSNLAEFAELAGRSPEHALSLACDLPRRRLAYCGSL
jgi:hypothetical protein